MQIRCYNCHKPFAISRDEVNLALGILTTQNQNHYNAFCPHCRRANRISRDELMRAAPDWTPESQEDKPRNNESEQEK